MPICTTPLRVQVYKNHNVGAQTSTCTTTFYVQRYAIPIVHQILPIPPIPPPTRETRPLSEISDEEFDTPTLFDDLSYEAEDVPDLNLDDSDDEPFVGKLYATKQDCQIGLAIYAIKQQFHFRQSLTTRRSFVLSCYDTHCDWRILAKELTNCGYYTIKKAQPNHCCTIDTRNLYRKKPLQKLSHMFTVPATANPATVLNLCSCSSFFWKISASLLPI